MEAARFSFLKLKNWRNFKSVDVELARRVFVVGPNASGKSNLLDVFRFLRHLTLDGGGLAQAVRSRRGISRLRSLHQKGRNSDIEIEVRVDFPDGHRWRYELAINRLDRAEDSPVVSRERVGLTVPGGGAERELLRRPDSIDKTDPVQLTQTAIQQVARTQSFRPLVEFLRSVNYLHLVPQLVREQQAAPAEWVGGDWYGRDLLYRIDGTVRQTREARLRRIGQVLRLAVPNLEKMEMVKDELSRPHLQAAFRHWRGPAAQQDEREFSDGTLRLIGLLWAMQERSGPLLLEEPELSLHAAIVRQLAPFLSRAQRSGGRQALVSTHSDLLMADPGIGAEEVLLVRPVQEGSELIRGADRSDISRALQSGLTAADVIMPLTQSDQIDLFASAEV
jgi:predicted ATPase